MTSFGTWRVRALIRRRRSRTVPASVVLIMIVGGGRRQSLKAACQASFLRKSDSRAQLCVTIGMSASALLSFWALSRGHPRACTSFVYGLHAYENRPRHLWAHCRQLVPPLETPSGGLPSPLFPLRARAGLRASRSGDSRCGPEALGRRTAWPFDSASPA
jgi:hypothetical protein